MILHYEYDSRPDHDQSTQQQTSLSIIDVIQLNYGNVEHLGRIEKLVDRLRKGRYNIAGGILVFGQEYELIELFRHKAFLEDLYLMIVLLQDHPRMLSLALEFRPRYIATWNRDKMEILKTLKKFLRNAEKRSLSCGKRVLSPDLSEDSHPIPIKRDAFSLHSDKEGKQSR